MRYKYKRPEGKLYKVSIDKWNKTFAKRGRWPMTIAEVYVNDNKATIQYVTSFTGKVIFTVLLPILILCGVFLQGVPETRKDIKSVYLQKKMGSFTSDMVYKRDSNKEQWYKLMKLIGEE